MILANSIASSLGGPGKNSGEDKGKNSALVI